ncbi:Bodo-specific multi-copy gene family, putative [Bodo saltans]|uniref:Bodo-specific multi-copy gene family, putative n=1 Tax=Bodo saltans TaxID=75058 RepID=A0A0S4INB0_BODSA|nr:Bodo-specific multi-copy gene family, putative [Bodo saltans]|eukprot:CUE63801.1 Bodo-specific multi-copy gene family, putative [Bodo saltans]
MANVADIGPLVPLSARGYDDAIAESWKYEADPALRAPLHHLAGGVPRLLRLAFMKQPQNMSLASGSITALPRCLGVYSAAARAQYPVQPAWFPQAYTCLLASSTKAKVKGSDIIPVNPAWKKTNVSSGPAYALTYDEAAMMSMGTYNPQTNRFMVPPITLGDTEAEMRPGAPILPSQLHPFLSPDVIARYAAAHPVVVEHGPLFMKSFLYAAYARYLLAFWKDTRSAWVPLDKVFEGSIQPEQLAQIAASKGYEVNVSSGVKMSANGRAETNAATLCEDDAQGDAFLWCRQKAKRSEPFAAVVQILCQGLRERRPQLEHRNDLLVLTVVSQKNLPSTFPVEHAGDDIMINADAMSSLMIWPLTKKKTHD